MSSTPYIRLESFAAVVFLYMQVTVIVCRNAAISGCADSQLVDSSLTLKCRYIGKSDVTAIYWYNGSNLDPLALKPGSNVPHCDVHSRIDIFFDPHRINYTCNASSNVYTLTINPLQKLDNNVTWSCTFIDPEPDPVKVECTIHLSETRDVPEIIPYYSIIVFCAVFPWSLMFVYIIFRIIERRRKTDRRNKEQNAEASRSLREVPAIETDHHRGQVSTLAQLGIMEIPFDMLVNELNKFRIF